MSYMFDEDKVIVRWDAPAVGWRATRSFKESKGFLGSRTWTVTLLFRRPKAGPEDLLLRMFDETVATLDSRLRASR